MRQTAMHRLRPVPALDGLRGLAVAAVVLFHFPTHRWLPGGQFGVDVFFVLSGCLVTAGLMDQFDRAGGIRLGAFAARRGRRLLPALVAFLATFALLAVVFGHDAWFSADPFGATSARTVDYPGALLGVGAALTYIYNIVLVHGIRTAMPLAHLWTLAIEGQFYLGWALTVRFVLPRARRALLPLTVLLAAMSAVYPWIVWPHPNAEEVIYFGTLPRLQQLLAGAIVAQVWRTGGFDRIPYRPLRLAAAVCGAGLLAVCLELGNQTFKYLGALTVNAVAASIVVGFLLVARAGAWSVTALSWSPLRWLGQRSYAIYLWHWPMAVWTAHWNPAVGTVVGVGAALLLAELSWRLVERRFQSRGPGRRATGESLSRPATAT